MLLDSRFLTLPSYSYRMHIHTRQLILMRVLRYCQEILFEIGFIEEMRTTCGNKEAAQIFFTIPNSSYSQKYVSIRLTRTIGGQVNVKRLLR